MIILLDLNYTLVANSDKKVSPFYSQIEREIYRADLLEKIVDRKVILITARPSKYKEETLASIASKCGGWQPHDAYFNDIGLPPPVIKKSILERFIFPEYGPSGYFGIESNPATRGMYKRYGIESVKYSDFMSMP